MMGLGGWGWKDGAYSWKVRKSSEMKKKYLYIVYQLIDSTDMTY